MENDSRSYDACQPEKWFDFVLGNCVHSCGSRTVNERTEPATPAATRLFYGLAISSRSICTLTNAFCVRLFYACSSFPLATNFASLFGHWDSPGAISPILPVIDLSYCYQFGYVNVEIHSVFCLTRGICRRRRIRENITFARVANELDKILNYRTTFKKVLGNFGN